MHDKNTFKVRDDFTLEWRWRKENNNAPLPNTLLYCLSFGVRFSPVKFSAQRRSTSELIFVVNASMQTHGIAEPQLSLMAWRSARILNRVMGRDLFDLSMPPALIQWRSGT